MMYKLNLLALKALFIGSAILLSGCGGGNGDGVPGGNQGQGGDVRLEGAGATFAAPLVTAMADEYRDVTNGHVTLNYQSIGSGGGIRQFKEQTIMFGMTEAFLDDEVMAEIEEETGGRAFNIPITLADVVPTYNLPGVEENLVLDGETLVDIYMGDITDWDDEAIQELNPDVELPDRSITVVYRSDGSGTTNLWTSYFSRVSDEWRDEVGYGTSVSWPTGTGANGNEGVAGTVQNSPGAIGYNSLSYAFLNDIPYAHLINQSGNVIEPSFEATTEAADIDLPDDTRALFTNTPAEDGYPVAGFTWMLVYENLEQNNAFSNRNQAEEFVEFLIWSITEGQELSEDVGYARLPDAPVERAFDMIKEIKWEGEPVGEQILEEVQPQI